MQNKGLNSNTSGNLHCTADYLTNLSVGVGHANKQIKLNKIMFSGLLLQEDSGAQIVRNQCHRTGTQYEVELCPCRKFTDYQ